MNTSLELEPLEVASSYREPLMVYWPSTFGPISMLPDRRPPWGEFVLSLGTQAVLVLLLLWICLFQRRTLAPIAQLYRGVQLVNTPHPVDLKPAPIRAFKLPAIVPPPPEALKLPTPVPKVPKDDPPAIPKIEVQNKPPLQPVAPVIPKQLVKTNVFSTGSSQAPTIEKSPNEVQTGGFGDPRGVAAHDNNNRPVTIAQSGVFDLPSGPGYGNGTAGQHGTRGVVASSGFGDGTAIGDNSGRTNAGVHDSGFGDAQSADPNQNSRKRAEAAPRIKPAEIISKPTPLYTDEAKKLHIEGEVLLEVVFEGSGSIRVLRVVRGLGHGLDESAIKAAQQIHFNPAQKDGQPVDFTGVLHIIFQLA